MKINRVHKIGFVVTMALALLIWGVSYLKDDNLFVNDNKFYAIYDHTGGIKISSPVFIHGYKVGIVSDLRFTNEKLDKIIIEMLVKSDFNVPENSTAYLYSADLMGTKAIELRIGDTTKFATDGDTLISDIELDLKDQVSMEILPVKKKAEDLMLSIDSILVVVQSVFNPKTQENLKKSFASIKTTLSNLERTTYTVDNLLQNKKGRINSIINNVDSIIAMTKNNSENFDKIISNFSAISDSIAKADISQTLQHVEQTLGQVNTITERINNGDGSLGELLNNDTLYYNIENTTYNLNRLIKDINENPKRYLHFSIIDTGKKPKEEKEKKRKHRKKETP